MLTTRSRLVNEIDETLIVLDPSLGLHILKLRHHVIVTLDLHTILITHAAPKRSQHAEDDKQKLDELIHDQISLPVNKNTISLKVNMVPGWPAIST